MLLSPALATLPAQHEYGQLDNVPASLCLKLMKERKPALLCVVQEKEDWDRLPGSRLASATNWPFDLR